MLSSPLNQTLDYLKKFIQDNKRPPRLKELATELGITNKAVLDRLSGLEKEGLVSMPDGVLSLRLKSLENDIFISYANEDKEVAGKIFDYFEAEGFRVWQDNMRLKHGGNYISDIFANIRNSKTFIVLLSQAALDSSFVKEEVSAAKKFYIDNCEPHILPVKIKDNFDDKNVFPEIASINRRTLTNIEENKFAENLMHIANTIHSLAYDLGGVGEQSVVGSKTKAIEEFIKKTHQDIDAAVKLAGLPPEGTYPYREVIVAPLGDRDERKNSDLKELNKNLEVRIQGWGGDRFPPYYYMHGYEAENMDGWVKYVDAKPWPGRSWGLSYWAMDKNLNFVSRSVLREAYAEASEGKLVGKFSTEWLVFDVSRALIYAKRLVETCNLKGAKVTIKYSGLYDRELIILSSRRWGFNNSYRCKEKEITRTIDIKNNSDIKKIVYDYCYEMLTLFNWDNPNKVTLEKDIEMFIDQGKFPD